MNNIPFTNIHTHTAAEPNTISIKNNAKNFSFLPTTDFISIGIHPWYINEKSATEEISFIQKNAHHNNVLAIGECGLDKLATTELSIQEHIFKAQLEIAQQLQKPVIIHCVKAFDELIEICTPYHSKTSLIIHGFNKSLQLAKQLIDKGFYISLSHSIFKKEGTDFNSLPIEKLFLETDNSESILIEDVYQKAANCLHITNDDLKEKIYSNFTTLFNTNGR